MIHKNSWHCPHRCKVDRRAGTQCTPCIIQIIYTTDNILQITNNICDWLWNVCLILCLLRLNHIYITSLRLWQGICIICFWKVFVHERCLYDDDVCINIVTSLYCHNRVQSCTYLHRSFKLKHYSIRDVSQGTLIRSM